LKLANLVPQYFYQHRKLSLPGIGVFSLDDKVAIPAPDDKNFRDFLQHIQFKQSNILKAEDALIDFIRVNTGKIKPLAESDLESYVADGKLMLNIGKPFHIEGIGTLVKNRNGVYEFTPGEPMMERFEAFQPLREKNREKSGDQMPGKKSVFDEDYYPHESRGVSSRRLIIFGGIILGLAVVIWGGYTLYNKKVEPAAAASDTNILAPDSTNTALEDSLAREKVIADSLLAARSAAPGSYKYIFETTPNKKRAIRRHQQVSDISRGIKLESNPDSTSFSIYVVLPSTPNDTTRLKDSLNAWYYGSRPLRVTIQH
jgi:hypothetical protein